MGILGVCCCNVGIIELSSPNGKMCRLVSGLLDLIEVTGIHRGARLPPLDALAPWSCQRGRRTPEVISLVSETLLYMWDYPNHYAREKHAQMTLRERLALEPTKAEKWNRQGKIRKHVSNYLWTDMTDPISLYISPCCLFFFLPLPFRLPLSRPTRHLREAGIPSILPLRIFLPGVPSPPAQVHR